MTHPDRPPPYFYGLDAMRFTAALLVAAFHFAAYLQGPGAPLSASHATIMRATQWSWFGWVGVEIFFVISGAVIANSAQHQGAGAFVKSRFLRLYPAVWVCAPLSFVTRLLRHDGSPATLGTGLLASLAIFPKVGSSGWIDAVYWTLPVEMAFYSTVLLLLVFGAFDRLGRLAWCLTIVSGLYDICLFAVQSRLAALPLIGELHARMAVENLSLLRHGCLFAVGMWLWLGASGKWTPARVGGLAFALAGAGAEITVRALAAQDSLRTDGAGSVLIPLLIGAIAILLIGIAVNAPRMISAPRWRAAVRRLGLMTYPVYLIHNICGGAIMVTAFQYGVPLPAAAVLGLVSALAFAWFVSKYAEPFLRGVLNAQIGRAGTPQAGEARP